MSMLRNELGWDEAELGTVFDAIDCHGHVSREQVQGGYRLCSGLCLEDVRKGVACAGGKRLPVLRDMAVGKKVGLEWLQASCNRLVQQRLQKHSAHRIPKHLHQFADILVAEELRDPSADAELLRHLVHSRPAWWSDRPRNLDSL
jgi:hypothetical protein